jgi:hypothetical protein
MKKLIYIAMLMLILPAVFADIVAPPPSVVIGTGVIVIAVALVFNYGINFCLSLPISILVADTKVRDIAKGLLIITPIMLVLEILFIALVKTWRSPHLIAVWMFSFVLIFLCYFIIGEKMWDMSGWEASIVAGIMAVITNPMYILLFMQ